ncbi:MAG: prepilin-type N-terminal cleavage/methylation domain-containing protein [Candidatus Krumholzibacteriia bacterium]
MKFIGVNEKGMSLIEIMVAMVLFSIGILSLGMFIPYSTKKLVNAGARTTSVTIAQSIIDEAMTKSFDDNEASGALQGLVNITPNDMTNPGSLGPDGVETQATFNDVDDFNGLALDPVPGNNTYAANVVVEYSTAQGDSASATATFYKKISVTVTPKGGREPVTMSSVVSFKG